MIKVLAASGWTKQNQKYIPNSLGICTSIRVMVHRQLCCIPTIM